MDREKRTASNLQVQKERIKPSPQDTVPELNIYILDHLPPQPAEMLLTVIDKPHSLKITDSAARPLCL